MFKSADTSTGRKRAVKALAEGRIPGKPGPKPLSEEERTLRRLEKQRRFRRNHLDRRRVYEAEWARNKRAEKAVAEGRVPGIIGHLSTMTESELLDYLDKWRGDDRKFILQAKMQNYRCIDLGIKGEITSKDVIAQLNIQQGCCAFCGVKFEEETPEIDHWIPLKLGGTNFPENIRLLHRSCNRTKSSKHPNEFSLNN